MLRNGAPYGHAVRIIYPIPCLASRSSRAAGAVPPSDGVNLWADAATKQKRLWLETFLPLLCNIWFTFVKYLAQTPIKSILEGQVKLG